MGNCSYVNQEKSGPSNGWYCNKAGTYVDSSYWRNYCSGSTSYRYCPYLGGDDRFRTSNSTEKDESRSDTNTYSTQTEYSKHSIEGDNDSLYSGGYTGKKYAGGSTGSGSATGGGGGLLGIFDIFDNLLDMAFKLITGGGLIAIAVVVVIYLLWSGIRFLGAQIGIVKSPLTINMSLSENSSIQAENVVFQLISDSGTGEAVIVALNDEGTCSLNVKKDTYEFVQKYDGLSVCLGVGTIDGTSQYDFSADTQMLENWVIRFSFCDEDGNEIYPEIVNVFDSSGNELDLINLEENKYICPMVNLEKTGTITVCAEGFEEIQVEPSTEGRIMNCTIVLRKEI